MSNHLSGSKRLAVIQRWINGHDDPNWEVFQLAKKGNTLLKREQNLWRNSKKLQKNPKKSRNHKFMKKSPEKLKLQE